MKNKISLREKAWSAFITHIENIYYKDCLADFSRETINFEFNHFMDNYRFA